MRHRKARSRQRKTIRRLKRTLSMRKGIGTGTRKGIRGVTTSANVAAFKKAKCAPKANKNNQC